MLSNNATLKKHQYKSSQIGVKVSGIDPGFFIVANFSILLIVLMSIRAAFPNPLILRVAFSIVGIYCLYLVAPRFVPFFIFYWTVIWALQYLMIYARSLTSKPFATILTTSVIVLVLSPMFLWKLFPTAFSIQINKVFAQFLWTIFPQAGVADAIIGLVVPLGLSFATFRALDTLFKIRLNVFQALSFDRILYFGLFPPVLAVGPIIEYEEIKLEGQQTRVPLASDITIGFIRIFLGVIKVLFVSAILTHIAAGLWMNGDAGFLKSWGALLVYGIFFYINFSGYSDLSIGSSRLFGFKLKENFDNPYFKTNLSDFWNAWHMSLTRWVFRYVFIPLGGMRLNKQYIAIFATIMVIALWHGLSFQMVIFGLYHGVALVIYRYLNTKRLAQKKPLSTNPAVKGIKILLVFVFFSISIPLQALAFNDIFPFYSKLLPGFVN